MPPATNFRVGRAGPRRLISAVELKSRTAPSGSMASERMASSSQTSESKKLVELVQFYKENPELPKRWQLNNPDLAAAYAGCLPLSDPGRVFGPARAPAPEPPTRRVSGAQALGHHAKAWALVVPLGGARGLIRWRHVRFR